MEKAIIFLVLFVITLGMGYALAFCQSLKEPSQEYGYAVFRLQARKLWRLAVVVYVVLIGMVSWLVSVPWYLVLALAAAWDVFFFALAFFVLKFWSGAYCAILSALLLFAYFISEVICCGIAGVVLLGLTAVILLLVRGHDK